MENIKDRLYSFLDSNNLKASVFERNCGLSNGFCNKISEKVTEASLKLIQLAYPTLNINWLKTGEGNMNVDVAASKEPDTMLAMVHILRDFIEVSKQNAEANRLNAEANRLHADNLERLIGILESKLEK